MSAAHTSLIDVVEAAYNLEAAAAEWLPLLLQSGGPLFDLGQGCLAMLGAGMTDEGQAIVTQLATTDGKPDLALAVMGVVQEQGPEVVRQETAKALESSAIELLSASREEKPDVYELYCRRLRCRDILTLHAHDPDGHGAHLNLVSPHILKLSGTAKERWERLAVHIATGHRLRRGLGATQEPPGSTPTNLPLQAEALLDPSRFLVSEAVGTAQQRTASEQLREAAVQVDRARGRLRKNDPDEALEIWEGMVRGRWSLVDWFDTDGRRFVLAKPNAPNLGDPRGLTQREHQVATYAARGESAKLIGYRFGISPQRVSTALSLAMRKLGVKTQPQLVERMRGLPWRESKV